MDYQPFIVRDWWSREILAGLPTPKLISEGGGEAWLYNRWQWRARDDAFDAAYAPAYRQVTVERNSEPDPYAVTMFGGK